MIKQDILKPEIVNMSDNYYFPRYEGLEKLVIFPDSEIRRRDIPNSSVWVFGEPHRYELDILAADVGCGITGFSMPEIDYKSAADVISEMLNGKGILGGGNHFVDLCSSIVSCYGASSGSTMLIHTDGKYVNKNMPLTLNEALIKTSDASKFRVQLGYDISQRLGVDAEVLGDWIHNSVEQTDGKVIYRKGAIKVSEGKIHILPAHIGSDILVYTVDNNELPPMDSMPHGTGRKYPRSALKDDSCISIMKQQIHDLRQHVYMPVGDDDALKSAAPYCYNDFTRVFEKLVQYIVSVGHLDIKAFIGKI